MNATRSGHDTAVREPNALPTELHSSNAKLVYLYLDDRSSATVDELQSSLGLGKMALFSVLDSLADDGFVEKHGHEYALAS